MYHYITKLSLAGQEFVSALNANGRSRELLTSVALARAIADTLPAPATLVDNVTSYYKVNSSIQVSSIISGINEIAVIDVDSVSQLVEKFYAHRYAYFNKACPMIALVPDTAIEDFFGISVFIPKEALAAIKADPINTTKLYTLASKFIAEVNNENKAG